jgi:hypothetical protein
VPLDSLQCNTGREFAGEAKVCTIGALEQEEWQWKLEGYGGTRKK